MGAIFTKAINKDFFKAWTPEMSYVLGYITADGCICVSKNRKQPFSLNITSKDESHLYNIRATLGSEHRIGKKKNGRGDVAFQLQIRNPVLTGDLMDLGILPRKTYHLNPIQVPDQYFGDFIRGFFDGDGTVYQYVVNGVPQIKAKLLSTSSVFMEDINQKICKNLNIPLKTIHHAIDRNSDRRMVKHEISFYVNDCEAFAKFIYADSPVLYLPRKRKIFERWASISRRCYIKQNYPSKIGWHLSGGVSPKIFVSSNPNPTSPIY